MNPPENPEICVVIDARALFPKQVTQEEGEMKTKLWEQAKVYLQGRIRRGEIKVESAKMPRIALRELSTSFGDRPINQLGQPAILKWLETNVHKSPATRRNELGAVRGFCQHLVLEGKLRRDPTIGIKKIRQPRKVVHTVNRDHIRALSQVCETPRDRALVALMWVLGLRAVDISRLEVQDWDRQTNILIVTGKGMHERAVPTVPLVAQALRDWIACDPRSTGALFPSSSGRLKPATISGRVSELMYRAGVKQGPFDGMSGHALRRTAGTETYASSHDIRAVRDLLGHIDYSSLKAYVDRADVANIADAVQSRFHHDAA
jgi:integrase/recombinase XerC